VEADLCEEGHGGYARVDRVKDHLVVPIKYGAIQGVAGGYLLDLTSNYSHHLYRARDLYIQLI
jgi:hypothetical protein